MDERRCLACGAMFTVRAQTPKQRYCAARPCQRERRRRWQADKRKHDPDYRENQRQAQQRWAEHNGDYWRRYRAEHPKYTEANRAAQHERDRRRRSGETAGVKPRALAKMDASTSDSRVLSGTYRLIPLTGTLAKMNACTVKIHTLSDT